MRFPIVDSDEGYLFWASVMLQNMLNEGLRGAKGGSVTWGVVAIGTGDFRLGQYSPDLLGNAYATFASLVANKVEVNTALAVGVCSARIRYGRNGAVQVVAVLIEDVGAGNGKPNPSSG